MSKRSGAGGLLLGGLAVCIFGYAKPTVLGGGVRPYAHFSVMAAGAMLMIIGVLLWRDS